MRHFLRLFGLLVLVARPSEVAAAWHMASSAHFVIYSQQDPPVLRAYAEKLERFDGAMRAKNPPAPPRAPLQRVTIYVLRNTESLYEVLGDRTLGGVYTANAAGAVAFTTGASGNASKIIAARAQTVLLHEYTHHFMLGNFPAAYPPWFTEGYAEFMSSARFEANGDVSLGVPENERGWELANLTSVSVPAMMAGKYTVTAELEAKGWLLVHYLTFEPSRAGQLERFLDAINNGEPAAAAATHIFGDLQVLDRELAAYVKRKSMSYTSIPSAKITPPPITITDLSPTQDALMPVRMKTAWGVDRSNAKRLASIARRLAEKNPDDDDAWCVVGHAELWAFDNDGLEAAADHLIARNAASPCGTLWKGYALLARAKDAKLKPDDKGWAEARTWIVRANRAAPEDSWPMSLYYRSYRWAHIKPTPNALEALLGAVDRAPQDDGLRFLATIEMLRTNHLDIARSMLAPLVGAAHGSEKSITTYQSLYDRIGKDDSAKLADEMDRLVGY